MLIVVDSKQVFLRRPSLPWSICIYDLESSAHCSQTRQHPLCALHYDAHHGLRTPSIFCEPHTPRSFVALTLRHPGCRRCSAVNLESLTIGC